MNTSIIHRILPLAALLLAGCAGEAGDTSRPAPDGSLPLSLTAAVVSHQSVGLTRGATDIHEGSFAEGETFLAYFPANVRVGEAESEASTVYTTTATTTPTAATQPYFAAGATSATVHAYYPYEEDGKQVTNETTSFSVELDQSATAGYNRSDLMYATATVTKTGATVATALTFRHKLAKIIVNATAGQGITAIKKVRIIGGDKTVALSGGNCTLGATSGAIGSADDACVKLYENATGEATVSCAALIPPQRIPAAGDAATAFLQIVTNEGTATYSLTGKDFAGGYSYTYNISLSLAALNVNTDITAWDNAGSTLIIDEGGTALAERTETLPEGAAAVDLGLPSGTLWANMNIGATEVTDYGTYFAWGETTGYTVEGSTATPVGENPKTDFSWATYNWTTDGGSTFTRYVPKAQADTYWGGEGEADNLIQLSLVDDAAAVAWGGKWRMPTQAEMNELLNTNNCTWTWQSNYESSGVAGYLVTSKANGNSIFLPAAGYRGGTSCSGQGSDGVYWSSALYSSYPIYARRLYFGSGTAVISSNGRYYGFTLRAVKSN